MNGQQNNTSTYGAADILRYLDGRMDRKEQHALERAMLDDELLADAVEGYRLMRESLSDEAILVAAGKILPAPPQKDKAAPVLSFSKFRWIGYAAAACLVIAAAWWVIGISGSQQALPSEDENNQPAFVNADPADKGIENNQVTLSDKTAPQQAEPSNKQSKTTSPSIKEDSASNNSLAGVTKKPASPVLAPAETMEIQQNMADAPEKARRMAPALLSTDKNSSRFTLTDSSKVVPASGWTAYREYLGQKIPLPESNSPGSIELTIAPDGKITAVTVTGTEEKDKTAISGVIKTGPAWKNKTGAAAKTIIRFQ